MKRRKRRRQDGGSDWFSWSSKADPSGGLDNARERERNGRRCRKERELWKRIKDILKNKILCPTPVTGEPSLPLHSLDPSLFHFCILSLLSYTELSLFWLRPYNGTWVLPERKGRERKRRKMTEREREAERSKNWDHALHGRGERNGAERVRGDVWWAREVKI